MKPITEYRNKNLLVADIVKLVPDDQEVKVMGVIDDLNITKLSNLFTGQCRDLKCTPDGLAHSACEFPVNSVTASNNHLIIFADRLQAVKTFNTGEYTVDPVNKKFVANDGVDLSHLVKNFTVLAKIGITSESKVLIYRLNQFYYICPIDDPLNSMSLEEFIKKDREVKANNG